MRIKEGERHGNILDAATWHFKNFPVREDDGKEEASRAYMDSMCYLSETIYGCLEAAYEEGYEDAKGRKQ